jgi:AcrR family transcriptional regulator
MTQPPITRRLSTADERREQVLEAAMELFAERGLHGTPTLDIAKAAGISQAYLFRLFPTKTELFVAILERACERVGQTFSAAAARARKEGAEPLRAMGEAYVGLLEDRTVLLAQLHGHAAAAGEPAAREAMRRCFAGLVALVERESGAPPEEVRAFFAQGMLCNVLAAMDAGALDEPWARVLAPPDEV